MPSVAGFNVYEHSRGRNITVAQDGTAVSKWMGYIQMGAESVLSVVYVSIPAVFFSPGAVSAVAITPDDIL